jgi:hypothetical protein
MYTGPEIATKCQTGPLPKCIYICMPIDLKQLSIFMKTGHGIASHHISEVVQLTLKMWHKMITGPLACMKRPISKSSASNTRTS